MGRAHGMGRGHSRKKDTGGGRFMGRGGGGMGWRMGRGVGRGSWGGMIPPPPDFHPSTVGMQEEVGSQISSTEELEILKIQATSIKHQLLAVNARIQYLEQGRIASHPVAIVDSDWCAACGACKAVCPSDSISVGEVAQIDRAKCIGCGQCVAECPQGALSLLEV